MQIAVIILTMMFSTLATLGGTMEDAALEILTGRPTGPDNCFIDGNGDGIRDGVYGSGFTIQDVNAITNRADVLALVAAQDAPAIAVAAEVASLEIDLVAAVSNVFTVTPPYNANVVANHRAFLRRQMKALRVIANDAGNTDAERLEAQADLAGRQEIINLVREIERLDPSWSIGDVE